MAKIYGLSGYVRGRRGNDVFRSVAGIGTVVSQYQPAVRNPRTLAQTRQRSKMNLVGQLSKIVPAELIAPLGSGNRAARARFVSMLLKAAVTTEENMSQGMILTATIPAESVIFSEGLASAISATATLAEGGNAINVAVTGANDGRNVVNSRVIVVVSDEDCYKYVLTTDVTGLTPTSAVTAAIPIPSGIPSYGLTAEVYLVPLVSDAADVVDRYVTGVLSAVSPDSYRAETLRYLASRNAFGRSIYVGRVHGE